MDGIKLLRVFALCMWEQLGDWEEHQKALSVVLATMSLTPEQLGEVEPLIEKLENATTSPDQDKARRALNNKLLSFGGTANSRASALAGGTFAKVVEAIQEDTLPAEETQPI